MTRDLETPVPSLLQNPRVGQNNFWAVAKFLDSGHQPRMKNNKFIVFIKRKHGIQSDQRGEVSEIWAFYQ